MDLQLADHVVVVTGASKGIGLAVTRTLLDEGAHVIAASRARTPELDGLDGLDGELVDVAVDLMDPDGPAHVIATAAEAFGRVDVLVNNVGGPPPGVTLPRGSFFDATDDDYGAAKAAMNNLTKALSEEFGPQGIRVNTVSPGPVRTPWWTDDGGAADIFAAQAGTDRETVLTTVAPQAMGQITGRLADPQEVADVVAFLASPRSASTTGADFVVDCGMLKEI
jgi:NAD(P)-dependent dehydrogenase (short-subunit alcohol dehydrogenase family)